MITAHSGCEDSAPNSEEYIRHAMTLPVEALEVDVRRDEGGRLILSHNPLERGEKYVELGGAFEILREGSMIINCDLKEKGLEREVLSLAGSMGIDCGRIILTGSLTDWRDAELSGRVWLNPEEVIPDFYAGNADMGRVMIEASRLGYPALNIDYRYVDDVAMDLAGRWDLGLSLWTIDDHHEIPDSAILSRVINITTNFPLRIRAALEKK